MRPSRSRVVAKFLSRKPNDAFRAIVLTFRYAEMLRMCPWKVGAAGQAAAAMATATVRSKKCVLVEERAAGQVDGVGGRCDSDDGR